MNSAELAPFIRYGLMILTGYLVRGGWLPQDVADMIASDPAVIELFTAGVVGIVTLAWYLGSRSRGALVAFLDRDGDGRIG